MNIMLRSRTLARVALLMAAFCAHAGQAPGQAAAPDVPITHRDRVYAAEQFSNTIQSPTRPTTSCWA
jgi:hypothetical protein